MRYARKLRQITAALLSGLLLAGCGGNLPIMSAPKEVKGYSDAEAMIVITTEKNRYQNVYTDQIWDVTVDESGTTFQSFFLNEVKGFLTNMKTLNLLAEERGIELDNAEKDQIRKLTEEYYSGLTKEDLAVMGISQEDAEKMYREYHLANKIVNELTRDLNLEVSDNEAKVIEVNQIVTKDLSQAEEAYEKLQEEGSSFEEVAKAYSEDKEINRKDSAFLP